jgi:hypothetical protein
VCRRPPIRRRRACLRFSLMTSGTELQYQDLITMPLSHTTPSRCLVAFLIPSILCSICTVVRMLTRLVSSPAITACDWSGLCLFSRMSDCPPSISCAFWKIKTPDDRAYPASLLRRSNLWSQLWSIFHHVRFDQNHSSGRNGKCSSFPAWS